MKDALSVWKKNISEMFLNEVNDDAIVYCLLFKPRQEMIKVLIRREHIT